MKVFIAIMGLVFFTGMAWSFGEFYGTVYIGPGTGDPSGYDTIRVQRGKVDTLTGSNAQGQYSIQYLPAQDNYYLYAWNYFDGEKWTDSEYRDLPDQTAVEVNFHLHKGEDPEE